MTRQVTHESATLQVNHSHIKEAKRDARLFRSFVLDMGSKNCEARPNLWHTHASATNKQLSRDKSCHSSKSDVAGQPST